MVPHLGRLLLRATQRAFELMGTTPLLVIIAIVTVFAPTLLTFTRKARIAGFKQAIGEWRRSVKVGGFVTIAIWALVFGWAIGSHDLHGSCRSC